MIEIEYYEKGDEVPLDIMEDEFGLESGVYFGCDVTLFWYNEVCYIETMMNNGDCLFELDEDRSCYTELEWTSNIRYPQFMDHKKVLVQKKLTLYKVLHNIVTMPIALGKAFVDHLFSREVKL